MKNFILAMLCAVVLSTYIIVVINNSYEAVHLRSFNQLNHTDYTMKQWRVYQYEIEKLYPFRGQQ